MIAKDVMKKRVVTAAPEMTLKELAELLIEHQITGVPVVSGDGILLGVISQTDLVRHETENKPESHVPGYYLQEHVLPRGFQVETPDYTRVKDYMTPIVISARETDSVLDLAHTMLEQKIHRVVITEKGHLRGIVTTVDLLGALLKIIKRGARGGEKPKAAIPHWNTVHVRTKVAG